MSSELEQLNKRIEELSLNLVYARDDTLWSIYDEIERLEAQRDRLVAQASASSSFNSNNNSAYNSANSYVSQSVTPTSDASQYPATTIGIAPPSSTSNVYYSDSSASTYYDTSTYQSNAPSSSYQQPPPAAPTQPAPYQSNASYMSISQMEPPQYNNSNGPAPSQHHQQTQPQATAYTQHNAHEAPLHTHSLTGGSAFGLGMGIASPKSSHSSGHSTTSYQQPPPPRAQPSYPASAPTSYAYQYVTNTD
jgi:hypothetical protein